MYPVQHAYKLEISKG